MHKQKKHGNMAPWYYLSLLQILNNSYNKTRYYERDKAIFAYFENEIIVFTDILALTINCQRKMPAEKHRQAK